MGTIDSHVNGIWPAQSGAGGLQFVNTDLVNSVFIDNDRSLSSAEEVGPLNSVNLDGTKDWFASTLVPNVSIKYTLYKNASNWTVSPLQQALQLAAAGLALDSSVQTGNNRLSTINGTLGVPAQTTDINNVRTTLGTPAQTTDINGVKTTLGTPAQDPSVTGLPTGIFNTGVALSTKSLLVKNQAAISQNPNTSNQSATFNMTQIGFEIILTIYATGNFLSYYHLGLDWFDSNTGLQTDQEDFWFVPGTGSGASAHIIIGKGRTKGDQLVVTSEVPTTSSVSVTHSYVVLQNSRIYNNDHSEFETFQFNAAGVTGAAADDLDDILAAGSFSVPASGGIVTILLPFFNGNISLYATTGSGTTDLDIAMVTYASQLQVGGTTPQFFEGKSNTTGFLYAAQISLPAAQSQVIFTNSSASARTVQFAAMKSIQR